MSVTCCSPLVAWSADRAVCSSVDLDARTVWLMRWGGEVTIRVRALHPYPIVAYPTADGFTVETWLDRRPAAPLTWALETNAYTAHQPFLAHINPDGSSWERRVTRPADVANSYVFYHPTQRGDYTACGGENYRAGKAFHLYRAWARDAAGWQVWCRQCLIEGVLTITIPPAFLEAAVYPVLVDPTFGYLTHGGSTDDNTNTNQWFFAHQTPASSGTLTGMTAYVSGGASQSLAVSIYDNGAAVPGSKLASVETGTATTGSLSEITTSLSYGSITSGVQYWLGMKGGNSSAMTWAFDALHDNSSKGFYFGAVAVWPASAGASLGGDEDATIWGIYTASGGSRGLFQSAPLNGLGSGGSGYFRDPLAAPALLPDWLLEAVS